MSQQNKALLRSYFKALRSGDLAARDKFWGGNIITHGPAGIGTLHGLAAAIRIHDDVRDSFTHRISSIDDMVAEGDKVAIRFTASGTHNSPYMGIPPTGKRVTWTGTTIFRISGGKIVEEWFIDDLLFQLNRPGAEMP